MRQCSSDETVPWRCCTVAQQGQTPIQYVTYIAMWQTAPGERDLPVGIGQVNAVHQSSVLRA